jgi:hypothetical protein
MPDSFAGITVPEGEPDTVRTAAATFRSLAGGLHGVSGELQTVPGLVGSWQGPAASAFAGTVPTNGSCLDGAADAMSSCAQAARTYADALETAQEDAKAAIADARDAQRRIDAAQSDLENAQAAEISASDDIMAAQSRLSSGLPDPGAMADLDAAGQALTAAQTAASDARRRLEQAQDDLDRAQRRGERAEKDAKEAARAAAGAFEGVAGGSVAAAVFGGSPTAIEGEVLARVRAGDYSALDEVPMNYLPEDTQRAIGAEMAKDSERAAVNEGDESFDDMKEIVGRYAHDEEVATGFYNQLGGKGARDFVSNVGTFQSEMNGWDDPDLVSDYAPFATLLGTATRAGGLPANFTGGFLRRDVSPRDRLGGHNELKAFVMAGEADNYESTFLSDVGEEILIVPLDPANEDIPGHVSISDHQDFMKFLAGNEEASAQLLVGKHGPDDHFSNAGALLLHGPRYTDDGEALGALIKAGTHDLRGSNLTLANDAAHAVIQAAPPHVEHLGDEAKPALVTILDDHIDEFEYTALNRALPDDVGTQTSPGGIETLTYEESKNYLTGLVGDDYTREPATKIVGDRVGYDIYQSAATGDYEYASRAGALSEMSVMATADADLSDAKTSDTMDGLMKGAAGKLVALTPPSRVPGFSLLADKALGEVFSADAVQKALEQQVPAQLDAMQNLKQLSIRTQIELGQLPPEARDMLRPDGSIDISIVDGPNRYEDIIKVDTNGDGEPDTNLQFDLNHNEKIDAEEREITEMELYRAGLGPAEAGTDAMTALHDAQQAATHPPNIDDLPVPDGYENAKETGIEKLWPFDSPQNGNITNDAGEIVARSEDLRWDPDERVWHLPVEGSSEELHYQKQGGKWELVEKEGNVWKPVP